MHSVGSQAMGLKKMANSFVLMLSATAYIIALLLSVAEGKVKYYDFVLEDKNFTRLCKTKSALVVNGTIPGPAIYVNKGDTIFVNVYNQGSFKVTIHWHGVKQPRNPWSDGTEYITQCAIQPGANFSYEVIFSEEEGTVWWHAHNEWTRNTVHGAIVVYPEEGSSYPFPEPDGEEILVFGSWYFFDVNLVVDLDVATGVEFPISGSYTINSQPGDFCICSKESTYRWQVDYGKTYLLRVVNDVMSAEAFFAIAEHNLTIVGMDGSYVKPFVTSYIMIAPGQTMDILVTTNQTPGQYYMALRQDTDATLIGHVYDSTNVTAILEYRGNYTPPASPSFPYDTLPAFGDNSAAISFRTKLKSLYIQDVPKNITTKMYITGSVNEAFSDEGGNFTERLQASLNNITWVNPKMDVLHAYYNNMSGFYTEDFPDMPPMFFDFVSNETLDNTIQPMPATKVKVLEYGEEVEVVFQGTNILDTKVDHPMHLHGYSVYVLGEGGGNFDFEASPKTYNLIDPPLVNTFTLPRAGWVAVRFRALNPGVWLWHCHFDHHLSYGMTFVIIVKDGGTTETSINKPPTYMPPCVDKPAIKLWKADF